MTPKHARLLLERARGAAIRAKKARIEARLASARAAGLCLGTDHQIQMHRNRKLDPAPPPGGNLGR